MNGSHMRVYFDYNATTPLAPEVVEAVVAATRDLFGNASSVHHFGQQAKAALDDARIGGRGSDRRAIRQKSSSRAAAPRPTTSPSAAPPRRSSRPDAATSSPAPSSTKRS